MAISWRVRKQLSYLLAVILFFGIIAGFFVWKYYSRGTCFDNRQNQKETRVDCGGPCDPCPVNLKEPLILWQRFFSEGNGQNTYDAAALMENLNYEWGTEEINYSFKFYDKDNILIVERKGKTFLNPKERALIFENGLAAGQRIPTRIVFTVERIDNWKYTKKIIPQFIVLKKNFEQKSSLLEIEIKNNSSENLQNVYLTAALLNKDGNIFAASATKIDNLSALSTSEASFTWREIFDKEPVKIEIFPRVSVMK